MIDKNNVVEEGCDMDDVCGMDVNQVLSEEKNKEMMEHALGSLDDLL